MRAVLGRGTVGCLAGVSDYLIRGAERSVLSTPRPPANIRLRVRGRLAMLCCRTPQTQAPDMAQHLVVSIDIIDTLGTTDSVTMKLTMKFTNTDAATVPSVAVLNTTCSPRANGHMGGGRTHRSQRAGLSRSSQGQANRSTEPPSQSTKAADETELKEDGPAESATAESVTAESVTAEPTAAGLAAAESATVESTAAGPRSWLGVFSGDGGTPLLPPDGRPRLPPYILAAGEPAGGDEVFDEVSDDGFDRDFDNNWRDHWRERRASDVFDNNDDELRGKLAARRLLNDETEEATREAIRLSLADLSGKAATDEQSRPCPRELLGGTPLDHNEDALSHLMGVMGMRLLMIGAAVSKPWRNAARARLGAWRVLSYERVIGGAKLTRPLFCAPLPEGGIVVSESGGARLKVP